MNGAIAAINLAKKQLGLDDDTYRAKLAKITGKCSLRAMTEAERQKVLTVFRKEGFGSAPAGAGKRKPLAGKFAKKLQALWIAGWNLGVVENRDDAALLAFVTRQTGLDHVRFLYHADDAKKAIEGLKTWLAREAGVGFGNTNGQEWLASDGAKIAWAQWKILNPGVSLIVRKGFDAQVASLLGLSNVWLADLKPSQWQTVMNALGERVRAQKAGA
ncbi:MULTISPECIES: regulatory protein GemA [Rhizobium/Agrobacterium group]|uniref:regulatory protein GemA n=1 Tax=Rhizobium/Agrobacterium group TaxID=227290 RepID=UPI0015724DE5|nr:MULTISPECIES: regulatory protein GemA [Rhizobium/Agrobacterium group]MCF1446650.1 regulatory protein GemA [Allorhizobium ampelinum]NSZ53498.1 regulatory protein GemA [Agrobacterium vitis]NTA32257.1 regulatory protein GemA [Agrobacterium vitis]